MKTVGKRLQQARLARKLTVEEASRTTKLRPERILDLENDTYAHFPNLAYAKGFLVIYAKYLAVDISDFTDSFEVSSPVGRNDYQYLSNAPQARPAVRRREGSPATKPMIILAGVIGVFVAGALFIMYLVVSAQRLGFLDQPGAHGKTPDISAVAAPSLAQTAPPVARRIPVAPKATPALLLAKPSPAQAAATPAPAIPAASPAALAAEAYPSPVIEVRRAEEAVPSPAPGAPDNSTQAAPPSKMNEVILQPLKKTWVIVRKGQIDSPPVFEDWLYPDAKGLTLHGEKFWISVGEKGAVEIRKNGIPINYDKTVAIE